MNQKIKRYTELTKPKVTLLNLLVGVTCFFLAAFPEINWLKLAVFCLAGYLVCGGCGALNCAYEKDIDKIMQRTSKRAIPSGAVSATQGLVFGSALTATGICLSYLFFNVLTALMMTVGAVFYLLVYTVILKRTSSWNVVIGGAAGCFAALSGWTAVANSVSLVPLLVSAIDFLWTPGHLWGLAIKKMKEYKSAGIPMLPVKVGVSKAGKVILVSNTVTVAFSFLFSMLGLTGAIYLGFAILAGGIFLFQNNGLLFSASEAYGFKVFLASMPYLACLMAGLILDKIFLI